MSEKIYHKAVVGGTFDNFHLGHEKLIATAILQSEELTIGIATDELFAHKTLAEQIEPYDVREKRVKEFVAKHHSEEKTTITPISDIYGNTLDEAAIEAIFVTEENLPNVEKINAGRREKGFAELETVLVPFVLAEDGQPITSECIRKGEIDRNGVVYEKLFSRLLRLTDDLRKALKTPFGDVYTNLPEAKTHFEGKLLISVGDIITNSLHEDDITPEISIIDFKTRRSGLIQTTIIGAFEAKNDQGTIEPEAADTIIKAKNRYFETKQPQRIVIEGEEDLLALPAILFAPLGSIVLYGQFDEGIVVNHVTVALKEKVVSLLKQFE